MPARLVNLAELQPTDTLRADTISFLETLTPEQILDIKGQIQVWETNKGLLISDGNNRAAVLVSKGRQKIEVDYISRREAETYCPDFLDTVIGRAESLSSKGILSPYDLWQS